MIQNIKPVALLDPVTLRRWRATFGISQPTLARALDTSQQTVQRWESACLKLRRRPSVGHLAQLEIISLGRVSARSFTPPVMIACDLYSADEKELLADWPAPTISNHL